MRLAWLVLVLPVIFVTILGLSFASVLGDLIDNYGGGPMLGMATTVTLVVLVTGCAVLALMGVMDLAGWPS